MNLNINGDFTYIILPVYLGLYILYLLYDIRINKKNSVKGNSRWLLITFTFGYMLILANATLLPIMEFRNYNEVIPVFSSVNLHPFKEISRDISNTLHLGNFSLVKIGISNLFGNIFLLIPLAMMLAHYKKLYSRSLITGSDYHPTAGSASQENGTGSAMFVIVACLAASVFIEVMQWVETILGIGFRIVDIDDVILNTVGAGLGYLAFQLVLRLEKQTLRKDKSNRYSMTL